jgi:hypothetical protein
MNKEELNKLNLAIKTLHNDGDVNSYDIDSFRRIAFPRGFLRRLEIYRSFFTFIDNKDIVNNIALQMLHRDTLHWLWLKTDITADARRMLIKTQLINLASILEGILKALFPQKNKNSNSKIIDYLALNNQISNKENLKEIWESRNVIHLHEIEKNKTIIFSDKKYIAWHKTMATLIQELNNKKNIKNKK